MLITRLMRELLSPNRNPVDKSQQPMKPAAGAGREGYSYTIDWFSVCLPAWEGLFSELTEVGKILEIGSFEGMSTVWLIENAYKAGGKGEMYCIDTWQGGVEHSAVDMSAVERRFRHNVALARSRSRSDVEVHVLKGTSSALLASLVSQGHASSFDVIHVDGSHQCPDVLSDLVLTFLLCKIGGVMICDDYFWSREDHGSEDLLNQPKLAIDSFMNCYRRKVSMMAINRRQIYLRKTSD